MIGIITEILSMFSSHIDHLVEKAGNKLWKVVFGLALCVVSVLLCFVGIGFLGYSFYHYLETCLGATQAALSTGGLFLLIAIILLIISKKIISKK